MRTTDGVGSFPQLHYDYFPEHLPKVSATKAEVIGYYPIHPCYYSRRVEDYFVVQNSLDATISAN